MEDVLHRRRMKHKSGQGTCSQHFVCYCTMSTALEHAATYMHVTSFRRAVLTRQGLAQWVYVAEKAIFACPSNMSHSVCAAGRFIGTGIIIKRSSSQPYRVGCSLINSAKTRFMTAVFLSTRQGFVLSSSH